MNTTDQKINSLKPGQSVEISRGNGISVNAEMNGKGDRIIFYRQYDNGSWSVFHEIRVK